MLGSAVLAPVWHPFAVSLEWAGEQNNIPFYDVFFSYCYYFQRTQPNPVGGSATNPWTDVVVKSQIPNLFFTQTDHGRPGTIIGGDITASYNGSWMPESSIAPSPVSNHMTTSNGPAGANELFEDGSVEWNGPAQLHYSDYSYYLDYWD